MSLRWLDHWLGPCIRQIPSTGYLAPRIYLTFDDGPTPQATEGVLEMLKRHEAFATFFLVAQKAKRHQSLTRRIVNEGHSIGNHSLDHRYRTFFASDAAMTNWILESQSSLTESVGQTPIGFRSPAGVRTPPLHRALKSLNIPLIHWGFRFYDTRFLWTYDRAVRSLDHTVDGQIVLLHDSHHGDRGERFLRTLNGYLGEARSRGFEFFALTSSDVARASGECSHSH